MAYFSQFDHFYELKYDCAVDHAKIEDPKGMILAHHHDDYEFYFLDAGNRKYYASNKVYTMKPYQIVIFKPNIPHQVTINLNIPYERHLIYVAPKLVNSILTENPQIRLDNDTQLFNLSKKAYENSIKLISKINYELKYSDKYSSSAIKTTLTELLIYIFRNHDVSTLVIEKSDQRIQLAINYILENYANQITLLDCAKIAYMSPSHFSREFHKVTALSFKEFLNKIRIDASLELLKTGQDSIAQIAQLTGFSSESYFGYVFKNIKGVSPSKYRIKNKATKQS